MPRAFQVLTSPHPPPAHPQLDKRGATLDDKIKRLDAELAKHRDLIRRARPGPAQEAAKRRALTVLKQKRLYESCLLYTSPSPRDKRQSRMPSSA